ncbi:unnamed protein product [Cuscuta epithymum]|uniref:Uncharacterized protein n=1 Tax=Cuscuta epithymum TaxID=186058 RepID=A0AAV0FRM6_9ASTE|nr:unnamed protein product [Cuscuta epithymum]
MISHSPSSPNVSCDFSTTFSLHPPLCPCRQKAGLVPGRKCASNRKMKWPFLRACINSTNPHNFALDIPSSAPRGSGKIVIKRFSGDFDSSCATTSGGSTNFTSFQEDPIVDKLRTQLGAIHPIPSPPINRNILGFFAFFFFVGVVFDKVWTSRKKNYNKLDKTGILPQIPTNLSSFLEKDLQRKESVEWVNMVLGKLWKVYQDGIESWIIGSLQPVIDDLKKPDYVERLEIKQFSLGAEPLSVRSVDRRTSRRVNDLQYQIGLRYTGGARMLLMLYLKFGIIPVVVPVGVRNFDIDGELWVKLRLIPTEPWVGAVSWAFVSLPKIKLDLSPFRLFNLMAIPVLSTFLTKLLSEDLPHLFVRPKKIVLDLQKGKAVRPVTKDSNVSNESKSGEIHGNRDFAGELSVTIVNAKNLSYIIYGKTDPYVILRLGDQVIRSKRNSQTTVTGPPGEPIWNQDFHMLVADPSRQNLYVEVKDSLGFADVTVGRGEVNLGSLKDTVPKDKVVSLGGWGLFNQRPAGEVLLRLTYKEYVDDEDDERSVVRSMGADGSDDDDEFSDSDQLVTVFKKKMGDESYHEMDKGSLMDVLAALIVSEEFLGIVSSSETSGGIGNYADNARDEVPTSKSRSSTPRLQQQIPESSSEGFIGSALFWLAVITSISVLVAWNIGASSLFNP